jgi:hypothetical protein
LTSRSERKVEGMDRDLFREDLKKAIRASIASIHSSESLAGFVLVTDDDLVTVVGMATTKETLAASANPDLLFSPTDWPLEPQSDVFNELSKVLWNAKPEDDDAAYEKHVDASFSLLVDALVAIRDEGLFSSAVYLSVLSSDPGPHLEELETAALPRLNEPDLLEARQRFLKKWEHQDGYFRP